MVAAKNFGGHQKFWPLQFPTARTASNANLAPKILQFPRTSSNDNLAKLR
jgi:hypothetical protein